MERGRIFTLPNSISLSRLLLAFAFVVIGGSWQRTGLILAAATTDFLDGWLARRGNSSTVAGAIIDPLADRIFVLAAVSSYLADGRLTTGQYFIFLSRDIATAVGFVVARFIPGLTASAFQARLLGKTVTAFQLALLLAALHWATAVQPLILLIGALSAISIVDYTVALERARRSSRAMSSLLIVFALLCFQTTPAQAQATTKSAAPPSVTAETRLDAIVASRSSVQAGIGLSMFAGTYVRTGIVGAVGGTTGDGIDGRIDVLARFHLDPFRQSRWGPYGGGGLSARFDRGERTRPLVLVFAGVDGPVRNGLTTSFEAGLGGGARIGVILRRGVAERR